MRNCIELFIKTLESQFHCAYCMINQIPCCPLSWNDSIDWPSKKIGGSCLELLHLDQSHCCVCHKSHICVCFSLPGTNLTSFHISKWNKEGPPITEQAKYPKNKESIKELKSPLILIIFSKILWKLNLLSVLDFDIDQSNQWALNWITWTLCITELPVILH